MDKSELVISDLRAGYGSLDILNGIDLDVGKGEFVALMGPNGAGKSTLLKTLFGQTTIKSGSILWQGGNIAGLRPREILSRGVSYVPQGRCNFPLMTVDENLQVAAFTIADDKVLSDRDYVYELFPALQARRSTLAGNMSGGEQQLLEMAMAVLQRPKILLVDEPSVGLSPTAIGVVFEELQRIHANGHTILLVEQNARAALQVADRGYVLETGRVTLEGDAGALAGDSRIVEMYLGAG